MEVRTLAIAEWDPSSTLLDDAEGGAQPGHDRVTVEAAPSKASGSRSPLGVNGTACTMSPRLSSVARQVRGEPAVTTDVPPIDVWLTAADTYNRRLVEVVTPLIADESAGPSHASDWSIAQVLSHLGSGAENFTGFLNAGLHGQKPPGVDEFQPVAQRWNAKVPEGQANDGLRADAKLLEQLDALDTQQRQSR